MTVGGSTSQAQKARWALTFDMIVFILKYKINYYLKLHYLKRREKCSYSWIIVAVRFLVRKFVSWWKIIDRISRGKQCQQILRQILRHIRPVIRPLNSKIISPTEGKLVNATIGRWMMKLLEYARTNNVHMCMMAYFYLVPVIRPVL